MNWRWILMLAAVGVLVSLAGILGWIPSGGYWIPIGMVLVFAVLLGYNVNRKLFLHGFLTAVIWTLIGGALQFLMWDSFLANNPEVAAKLSETLNGVDARPVMAIGMVISAAAYGAILGLLALLAGKLLAEKPAPEPAVSFPPTEEKS